MAQMGGGGTILNEILVISIFGHCFNNIYLILKATLGTSL